MIRACRLLVLSVVSLLTGCGMFLGATAPGFDDYVRAHGATFSLAAAPAGEMSAEEAVSTARGERERHAAFEPTTPLKPAYGIISCPDAVTCTDAFGTQGVTTLRVWVITSTASSGRDAGRWLAINAVTGFYAVTGPD
jgi:hypothetical protein